MRQIIVAIIIVFQCTTLTKAQKTITKEEFEVFVNFANCRYVKAFIEKNDRTKPYYTDTYEKKIKPELERVSLANYSSIISFQKLESLLANNSPALELSKRINERISRFDEFDDNESLINTLTTTHWGSVDLSSTAEKVIDEIKTKSTSFNKKNNENSFESVSVKDQTTQTSKPVEESELKTQGSLQQDKRPKTNTRDTKSQMTISNFKLIVFSLLGLFFASILAIYFLLVKRTARDYIIKLVMESRRIEEKFTRIINAKSYSLTEKDISAISERVIQSLRLNEENSVLSSGVLSEEKIEPPKPSNRYLKGKSGKKFSRVENTPDNSFFRILNESGDNAEFEFFGNQSEAIAKRIFSEDICTIVKGGYQNAQSVTNVRPGKIKRIGDYWEVVETVEIKLG